MKLSRIALSLGIATALIGAVLPIEAHAQRTVRARKNFSTNGSAKTPLGVGFALTDTGSVENFSYTNDEGVLLIKNATGSLVDTNFSEVSDSFSYELSLTNVSVDTSSASNINEFFTDISVEFEFENVSEIFSGLSSDPSAQDLLDFLVAGDSTFTDSGSTFLNDNLDDDNSNVVFPVEDLISLEALGFDLPNDGKDPVNAGSIEIIVLEEENAQVPEPGVTLGLFTLGSIGVFSLRKKKQSLA
ncbi:PEP-CTERM sorting domain-containing protein [Leptolyngbyaceae cyanobacterium CCMR0082]|uniref:PEP-CTERM sorting domain-containing protein n=2 Tax=Adonisia turfae TaxID=2950184 RepID=A0A6M0S7Z1_9CYAN|nr:PEP-CTERM sorting domain-containing protein [Adonisia turfae]NEZ57175.1 PEP-CTERM sorting domain-containing protein [Adonisia turfae CCMR0081]NEZ64539.1 PEP-CTERM sorting domain-containing protein [Adonisia turfae CCMR0082]